MSRFCWSLALTAMLTVTAALAGEVTISGSGTWDDTAPTTTYSAPDTSWSFSFMVPNPLDANPTSMVSDSVYLLGGSPVGAPLASVTFFDSGLGGLFDMNFSDGAVVSLYGAQVFDDNTLALFPGTYAATIGYADGASAGSGTVTLAGVPEPSTLVGLSIGLLCVAGAGLRHRRRVAVA